MTFAAGMGGGTTAAPGTEAKDWSINHGWMAFSDSDAARRLRDKVAREIAAVIEAGGDSAQCEHLTPVYRWLNEIIEPTKERE